MMPGLLYKYNMLFVLFPISEGKLMGFIRLSVPFFVIHSLLQKL